MKRSEWGTGAVQSVRVRWCGPLLVWGASLLFCASLLGQSSPAPELAAANLETWLEQTEHALTNVDNYTAVFHRVELVKDKLVPEEVTVLKFKRPFKIYLRWLSPNTGQESLYVAGANQNKIRAHGSGVLRLVTVNLEPTGAQAMENSRHPITEAGLHHLVGTIAANLRRALRAGELKAKDHGEQTVYGRKTRELEGILPPDATRGYYCYRCIVNLDLETKMPLRTQIFDWENRLAECYGYERLKLNPGLTDKDFNPSNPEYHF